MPIRENVRGPIQLARRRMAIFFALAATCAMTLSISLRAKPNDEGAKPEDVIVYPEGFRNWNHVRSALVGPASPAYQQYGGLHHIYANEKSMEGYRDGKFPDGSVLVFDLFETKEFHGSTIEGNRKFIDMMVKDSNRFADTGGWGYERYAGDSRTERVLTAQAKADCYKCHATQKSNDYVFSKLRN